MALAAATLLHNIVPSNILRGMAKTPPGAEGAYREVQVVLKLREDDVQVFAQAAEYRNALVRAEGKRLPGYGWSRTSLLAFIAHEAAGGLREEVAPVVEQNGPMPTVDLAKGKDKKERARFSQEMDRYVARLAKRSR